MTRLAKPKTCGVAAAMLLAVLAVADRAGAQSNPPPSGAAAPTQIAPQPSTLPAPPPQPPPPSAAMLPPQPPPAERPGFLHQLGVWWDDSVTFVDRTIKGNRGTVDDLNKKSGEAAHGAVDAAKGAATATGDAMKSAVDATKGAAFATGDAMKGAATATGNAVKGAATATGDAMKGAVAITRDAAGAIANLPNMRPVQVRERCAKAPNGASDCDAAAAAACRAKGFAGGKPLDVRTAANCDAIAAQTGQIPDPSACPIETVVTSALCQ